MRDNESFIGVLIGIILIALAGGGYVVYDTNERLTLQGSQLAQANAEVRDLRSRISQIETESKALNASLSDLKNQVSVIRVALSQGTSIKFDSSGAIIKKRGAKDDGFEFR
jgi:septal ring factor EnvC (AmiA/AmiB activator)